MKTFLVIAMLIIMASTQTTVTPKTQACVCSNLLNSQDCGALTGCQWTAANTTNSTNATSLTGTCGNATTNTTIVQIPTFCGSITNGTLCALQVGCAYFNTTCQIFTGCTAYVKTTHSDCQLISSQCTTDGTRCALPAACNTYTTQAVCVGSQGSTTKNCKWTPTAGTTTGTCSDTICTDAPTTLTTLAQCQAYISTCSSTGKGCVATLLSCTTYLTTDGCSTRIGLEGKCMDTTPSSNNCRAQVCTDATSASATSCTTFLSTSTCLFNGKACVASPLPACNTYLISQTCDSMIGLEGKCTTDKNSATNCKAYTCSDAPTSTITDSDCQKLSGSITCITNGQGCVISPLPSCSSLTGTTATPCTSFKGLNGICKASTTATCTDRTCTDDATKTFTTDAQCDSYFKGCVTKGVGCVTSRLPCSSYTGTTSECSSFIGSDSNCTAPSGQTSGNCQAKSCTDTAVATATTNQACSAYSFQCATTGNGCTKPDVCTSLTKDLTCQGKSDCSYNKLCIDRSDCANYTTQTLCTFNKQQYLSGAIFYERPCTWSGSACSNTLCSTQLTSLTTDDQCNTALAGCLTKNGGGCIDISADCNQYAGITATCENFTGLNKKNKCTQISSAGATTACIVKTCDVANSVKGVQTSSSCGTFLSGCNFDGKDNCTNQDCTKYFGILSTCQNITTALSSNKAQKCWQSAASPTATSPCTVRTCADAPSSNNSDSLCASFLDGCVTNGAGCVVASTICTSYVGGTIDTCSKFYENGKQCTGTGTGTTSLCRPKQCTDSIASPSVVNCEGYLNTCTYDGTNCLARAACSTYTKNSATLCNALKDTTGTTCGFITGANACSAKTCGDAITSPSVAVCEAYLGTCTYDGTNCLARAACSSYAKNSATLCNALKDTTGTTCGFITGANACSAKTCGDAITSPSVAVCEAYLGTCTYDGTNCVARQAACSSYTKNSAALCNALKDTSGASCGFISGSACSAKTCGDSISSPSVAVCEAYLGTCTFDGTNCVSRQACSSYTKNSAALCNALKDTSGASCGFISGSACSAKTCGDDISSPSVAVCEAYLGTCTFDGTNCVSRQACSSYTKNSAALCNALKDTSGASCGFISGSACSAKTCGDSISSPSVAVCEAYLGSCTYDGTGCIARLAACSSYTKNSATLCNALKDTSGASCGFITGASNCSSKTCGDSIASPSAAVCSTYLATCQYNGTTCIASAACNTYVASGTAFSDKANYCNALNGPTSATKCTYKSGDANCSDASTCSSYQVSGFSNTTTSFAACSLLRDSSGLQCGFTTGQSTCSTRTCAQQLTSASCSDTWLTGCVVNPDWNCKSKVCTDQKSFTTDADCKTYRDGCVTNGAGCVDITIATCAIFTGTQASCQKFTGKDGPCTNDSSAVAGSNCKLRQCGDNTNATSQATCDAWIPKQSGVSTCIWNGTTGCIANTTCDQITGTIDSCALVQASDGPCSLSASSNKCVSNSTICTKAPSSFITDAQCQKWHTSCLSTGFGCISDSTDFCKNIVSGTLCTSYKTTQSCDLAIQCAQKPPQCSGFTTPYECNNISLTGTAITCGWNFATSACATLTCDLLPITTTTDSACSTLISTCTTNGAGCVTKSNCSGYNKIACGVAATLDGNKCIWSSSVCRSIVCSDNTTAKSDSECDTYLKGCRTTGTGCSNSFSCSAFTSAALCLKDASNNPCYWYKGACQLYTQCTDILQTTHTACQQLSPLCTTDGTKCIAITGCAKTNLAVSCVVGTDGPCGYLPASGTTAAACAPYTNCAAATGGTTFAACQAWGPTCVSNGTACISQTSCTGYLTEAACGNLGTSGTSTQKCIFSSAACRPQVCTDATATTVTAIATHTGCAAFPATTLCTTNGTNGCIAQSTCSSYSQTLSAACVLGTDGPCFFQTTTTAATATTPASTTTACRLKQCSDITGTTSASCSTAVIGTGTKCVSNGVNCINQSTCSSYTARESCLGGGSDGACAFTPGTNTTTPNVGTCQLFTACNQANQDQTACSTKSASCYFTPAPTNGTSSCTPHNCTTKASGSTCFAVPNFDLSQYQICVLAVGTTTCQPGSPAAFPQSSCYASTLQTYTWNPTSGVCQSCQAVATPNNTNTTNNTNNTYGYLVSLLIAIAFMI